MLWFALFIGNQVFPTSISLSLPLAFYLITVTWLASMLADLHCSICSQTQTPSLQWWLSLILLSLGFRVSYLCFSYFFFPPNPPNISHWNFPSSSLLCLATFPSSTMVMHASSCSTSIGPPWSWHQVLKLRPWLKTNPPNYFFSAFSLFTS